MQAEKEIEVGRQAGNKVKGRLTWKDECWKGETRSQRERMKGRSKESGQVKGKQNEHTSEWMHWVMLLNYEYLGIKTYTD